MNKNHGRNRSGRRLPPRLLFLCLGALLAGLTSWFAIQGLGLHSGWAYLAGINAATAALYAFDKASARRGALRVPERTLHLFAALGGTPAALICQRVFRHKTIKGSFQLVFWALFVLQAAAAAAWFFLARR